MHFKVALCVETYGAYFGRFSADADMSAVAAFPDRHAALAEHLVGFDIAEQSAVALLMGLFDRRHSSELTGQIMESLLVGLTCEAVVHVGPLIVFAFGGMEKIDGRVAAYSAERFAP